MTTIELVTVGERTFSPGDITEAFARYFSGSATLIGLERELFGNDSTRGNRMVRLFNVLGLDGRPVDRDSVTDEDLAVGLIAHLLFGVSKRELDRRIFGSTLSGGKTVVREWNRRFGINTVR